MKENINRREMLALSVAVVGGIAAIPTDGFAAPVDHFVQFCHDVMIKHGIVTSDANMATFALDARQAYDKVVANAPYQSDDTETEAREYIEHKIDKYCGLARKHAETGKYPHLFDDENSKSEVFLRKES